MMRSIANLLRSLYSLTRVSAFKDIADAIYKVDRTQRQVEKVKKDAQKVKDGFDQKKSG